MYMYWGIRCICTCNGVYVHVLGVICTCIRVLGICTCIRCICTLLGILLPHGHTRDPMGAPPSNGWR